MGKRTLFEDAGAVETPVPRTEDEAEVTGVELWYEVDLPAVPAETKREKKRKQQLIKEGKWVGVVQEKRRKAEALYMTMKQQHVSKLGNEKLMGRLLHRGTASDKMSALMLLVRENPFYALEHLDQLLRDAKKGRSNRSLSFLALNSLKDSFIELLLPDEPLVYFRDRNLLIGDYEEIHLVYWYFEGEIKRRYGEFVSIVEAGMDDNVLNYKNQMGDICTEMLMKKPELEGRLLSTLVNKLGDANKKFGSKVVYLLELLIEEHPVMIRVIVQRIHEMLLRSNVGMRAHYYAIVFMNSIRFYEDDPTLPFDVAKIYIQLFQYYTKDNEVDSRILLGLLAGTNKALPFLSAENARQLIAGHVDDLFRLCHVSTFNKTVQCLLLLFQFIDKCEPALKTRFYRALYNVLFKADMLLVEHKLNAFFNLVFRSVSADTELGRSSAILKRLLQVCLHSHPTFVCCCLYTISEVIKKRPELCRFYAHSREANEASCVDLALDEEDRKEYTELKREPEYAGAALEPWYELALLQNHYHPSIVYMANELMEGHPIVYDGNPLEDFSLNTFLARFVLKNPKKKEKSIIELRNVKIQRPRWEMVARVDEPAFAAQKPEDVRPEEKFFYEYYANRNPKRKLRKEEAASKRAKTAADLHMELEEAADEAMMKEIERVAHVDEDTSDDFDFDLLGSDEMSREFMDDDSQNDEDDFGSEDIDTLLGGPTLEEKAVKKWQKKYNK